MKNMEDKRIGQQVILADIDRALALALPVKAPHYKWENELRMWIHDALAEADKNPDWYDRFEILIPERMAEGFVTLDMMKERANCCGGQISDWVEYALWLAWRISNGESWESVCNEAGNKNWYRVIVWKDGELMVVFGYYACYRMGEQINHTAVPAVTIR